MRRSCLLIRVSSLRDMSSSSWDGSLTPRSRCMILPRMPGPPEGPAVEASVPSSRARVSTAGSSSSCGIGTRAAKTERARHASPARVASASRATRQSLSALLGTDRGFLLSYAPPPHPPAPPHHRCGAPARRSNLVPATHAAWRGAHSACLAMAHASDRAALHGVHRSGHSGPRCHMKPRRASACRVRSPSKPCPRTCRRTSRTRCACGEW